MTDLKCHWKEKSNASPFPLSPSHIFVVILWSNKSMKTIAIHTFSEIHSCDMIACSFSHSLYFQFQWPFKISTKLDSNDFYRRALCRLSFYLIFRFSFLVNFVALVFYLFLGESRHKCKKKSYLFFYGFFSPLLSFQTPSFFSLHTSWFSNYLCLWEI